MNIIENNVTKENRPWVIVFREEWEKTTPTITKSAMQQSPDYQFWSAENWFDLSAGLVMRPALIIIHHSALENFKTSINDYYTVISTMCVADEFTPKIAIAIDKDCSVDRIKEIKNANIDGIVPSVASYGITAAEDAIVNLVNGKQHWPKKIIDEFLRPEKPVKKVKRTFHLTARQQQVMDLVCHRGLPNKAIAGMLHITESTVKIHVSAILKEYGVRNRTQLVLAASSALHD